MNILKYEAFLRLLPPKHPITPEVQSKLARYLAGYKGERSLEYYFSFLSQKEFHIFYGIRLPFLKNYFQMDVVLVTSSFILIVEVKHISGTLIFDPQNNQLIRQSEGKEEVFLDPVEQVRHQKYQLSQWISRNKLPNIPIETVVVITNSSSKIMSVSPNVKIPDNVIRSSVLLKWIEKLKALYKTEKHSTKEMNKLGRQLIKQHTENNPDLLNQYQVSKSELLKGVYCPNCSKNGMNRSRGRWYCPECFYFSSDAHVAPLKNYALLISPTITNQQLRNFLQIKSSSTANKIISSMNLKCSGSNKGRVYNLNELFL